MLEQSYSVRSTVDKLHATQQPRSRLHRPEAVIAHHMAGRIRTRLSDVDHDNNPSIIVELGNKPSPLTQALESLHYGVVLTDSGGQLTGVTEQVGQRKSLPDPREADGLTTYEPTLFEDDPEWIMTEGAGVLRAGAWLLLPVSNSRSAKELSQIAKERMFVNIQTEEPKLSHKLLMTIVGSSAPTLVVAQKPYTY